ncbi:MAG: diacylglycerol kinase family lipid kinase [Chloroflexia bacterium]|nr:diacylglycerol kinase family lipid kinase [Chloroflexia bacterium]
MPSETLYLVVNPVAAGGRAGRVWPRIQKHLRGLGLEFEAGLTRAQGEATRLARQAVRAGHRTVVAVGGDGTINEVINGLIAPGQERSGARLGVIITGRGSDLARTIGIPSDIEAACERLAHPRSMPMDLGLAEYSIAGRRVQRFFGNIAGIGFDGEVVARANKIAFARGTIPYLSGLLSALVTWRNREVELLLDGQRVYRGKVYLVAVANGQYFGGGMRIVPEADPNDGLLDVAYLDDISKIQFLRLVPSVYEGSHVHHPAVHIHRARQVEVYSEHALLSELDGELGGNPPMTFQVIPEAVEVLV